ncbi:MAG: GLPGLI family protein [Roseivirga sp.]|jgi:GLPGLI family protein
MKISFFNSLLFTLVIFVSTTVSAQMSGQVTYEQIVDYDFGNYRSDPRWEAYVADLPKQNKSKFILSFSSNEAFYQKDLTNETAMSEKLQNAIGKGSYGKGPKTETQQVYYDLDNDTQTEQIQFMTRDFQITSALPTLAWKLTSKRKKVLDYVCFGAEISQGDKVYTAWFTSEIPITTGPAGYYGLPGLVLAVEKNEEIFILATQIDWSERDFNFKEKLKEGKKMTREQFNQVVTEKVAEYNAAMKNKSKGSGKKGG